MKYTLLSLAVLSCMGVNAQQTLPEVKTEHAVGIETAEPRATLDVNGDTRIQTIEDCTDCEYVLVTGSNHIVQKVALSDLLSDNSLSYGADLGVNTSAAINDKTEYVISFEHDGQEIPGLINNSTKKINVKIPYSVGNGVSYNEAISKTMTESASAEDGVSVPIEMKILRGTLAQGDGEITAEITTPEEYKIKKLAPGVIQKIADFNYTIGGATRTVTLNAIGGVPDRLFGVETNGKLEHQYIYIPVPGPNGQTWLNNNLGADYADMNSPHFNPTKQAEGNNDVHAWGAFIRLVENPDDRYILFDWTNPEKFEGRPRNPYKVHSKYGNVEICPEGYRLPTVQETLRWQDVTSFIGPNDIRMPVVTWFNTSASTRSFESDHSRMFAYLTTYTGDITNGNVENLKLWRVQNGEKPYYGGRYEAVVDNQRDMSKIKLIKGNNYLYARRTTLADVDANLVRCIKK